MSKERRGKNYSPRQHILKAQKKIEKQWLLEAKQKLEMENSENSSSFHTKPRQMEQGNEYEMN